jgi:hypothetical protein
MGYLLNILLQIVKSELLPQVVPILLLSLSPHAHILLLFLDGGTSSEIETAIGLRHCRNKMILK